MPYSAEHKANTRRNIVRSARRLFNRRGFDEVSIDEIMAGAGLTRGGFYAHFKTKDELYAEAVTLILEEHPSEHWDDLGLDLSDGNAGRSIVSAYLSQQHLDDIDGSCPMIALPSDIARGGPAVKLAFRQVFGAMVGMFDASLDDEDEVSRRERALAIASLCVGGMVLARAMDGDDEMARSVRRAAHACAQRLGGWEQPVNS